MRNESVLYSAQTFLMKAATAAAGGLTGVGLSLVGYKAELPVQCSGTIMGIRVLMIVIPVLLAVLSLYIYKRFYTLKDEQMEEITRRLNEKRAFQIEMPSAADEEVSEDSDDLFPELA
ncbi:MFS transporter [Ileibacterium valens]|uniref:MFS transporter n=1 Tax=Ileibacterium valens TaxID=1862668 RepID=UPI00259AF313|nr:MFS transporter [Ileibacterium valens]